MFVTALFIIAKNENSPNISQRMHKQKVDSYNGIFDNKKKIHEILIQAIRWMDLESIVLSKRSQTEKTT